MKNDRTGGAVCNVSYWHVGVQDGFGGPQTLLKPNSHDCTFVLILESGWLRTSPSLSMSGFRGKQRTLVTQSAFQGMQVQVLAKAEDWEEACQIYDTTTKLIFLHRSPKTSLWDSCGLNLHTKYCIQTEIINYKGKVPVNINNNRIPQLKCPWSESSFQLEY